MDPRAWEQALRSVVVEPHVPADGVPRRIAGGARSVAWQAVAGRHLPLLGLLLVMLEAGLIGVFVSLDLILFYLFWGRADPDVSSSLSASGAAPTAPTLRSSSSSTRWQAA